MHKTRAQQHIAILTWDEINDRYGSQGVTQLIIGPDREGQHTDYLITDIHTWGICFCTSGSCNITIDGKSYNIIQGEMYIVLRNKQLSITHRSKDHRGFVIAAEMRYLADINPSTLPGLIIRLRRNPCAKLDDNKLKLMHSVYNLIPTIKKAGHIYRDNVMESLMKTLYYEVAGIYKDNADIAESTLRRKEIIYHDFSVLVLKHSGEVRDVSFYAEKLNISQRYLAECVRHITKYTPSQWIAIAVIHKAKLLLGEGKHSVADVSYMLNFPNPSFFAQYFKKHTGISPKVYKFKK